MNADCLSGIHWTEYVKKQKDRDAEENKHWNTHVARIYPYGVK